MPRCSAFTPPGHFRFSSKKSQAELIFKAMFASAGGEQNISSDFNSLVQGELYADAIAFARAKLWADRAGGQFRPRKVLELLPNMEREYGLIPTAKARVHARRADLIAAAKIAGGARRENVETVLRALLGSDFLAYLTVDKAAAVASSATPGTVGNWVAPGTPMAVLKTTSPVSVLGSQLVVHYAHVAGDTSPLKAGMRVGIDSGDYGRVESVLVTAVGASQFTATFTKPHNYGVMVTTGRMPHVSTTKRVNLVVLTSAASQDAETVRRVHRTMRKLLRGVSVWQIVRPSSPGNTGPFTIGSSIIGIDTVDAWSF